MHLLGCNTITGIEEYQPASEAGQAEVRVDAPADSPAEAAGSDAGEVAAGDTGSAPDSVASDGAEIGDGCTLHSHRPAGSTVD